MKKFYRFIVATIRNGGITIHNATLGQTPGSHTRATVQMHRNARACRRRLNYFGLALGDKKIAAYRKALATRQTKAYLAKESKENHEAELALLTPANKGTKAVRHTRRAIVRD